MAPRFVDPRTRLGISLVLMLSVFVSSFFKTTPVLADEPSDAGFPDLGTFSQSVWNGNANELRGVYISETLALPVVQQPSGQAAYVSSVQDVITQFGMAAEAGNVGLLAHNYLAGTKFFQLQPGMEISLVYGDGRLEQYIVSRILQYQALDPYSPFSDFRDLNTGITSTAGGVFAEVYRGERHVTFQTCIAANGNSSWGRLFVIAEPKPAIVMNYFFSHQMGVR